MDESADATPYVAGSSLVRLFGSPGRTRIVEAFLSKRGAELTGAEVAKLAGVDRSTVSRNIDVLIELGLVERRESSSADLYRIDADNSVVRALADARRALLGAISEVEPTDDESESDEGTEPEAYVDRSGLVRLLGTPGRTKMMAVFLGTREAELTGAEIAKFAGIDKSTVSRNIDVLVQLGIIEEARTVGNSVLYRLDSDSEVSKALGKAQQELLSDLEVLVRATDVDHVEEKPGGATGIHDESVEGRPQERQPF